MIQAIQAFLLDHAEEVKNDGEVVGYTLNLSMDEMDQLLTILERKPTMNSRTPGRGRPMFVSRNPRRFLQ